MARGRRWFASEIRDEALRALRDLDTGPPCAEVPHAPHDEFPYPSCQGFVGCAERPWEDEDMASDQVE